MRTVSAQSSTLSESSNSHRAGSIYLTRRDGTRPLESDVLRLLREYGQISKVWYPTDTERELWGLPRGIWAKFTFWQDYSDACRVRCGLALPSGSRTDNVPGLARPCGVPR